MERRNTDTCRHTGTLTVRVTRRQTGTQRQIYRLEKKKKMYIDWHTDRLTETCRQTATAETHRSADKLTIQSFALGNGAIHHREPHHRSAVIHQRFALYEQTQEWWCSWNRKDDRHTCIPLSVHFGKRWDERTLRQITTKNGKLNSPLQLPTPVT